MGQVVLDRWTFMEKKLNGSSKEPKTGRSRHRPVDPNRECVLSSFSGECRATGLREADRDRKWASGPLYHSLPSEPI